MSAVKIVKVLGESQRSWDDAVNNAVEQACETIDGVTGVEVLNMTADVKDGKVFDYKATVQLAFPVKNDH